jgi:hypothetical protein
MLSTATRVTLFRYQRLSDSFISLKVGGTDGRVCRTQATINPYLDTPPSPDEKQSFVESLAIEEVIEDGGIPREALVLSVLLEDSFLRPTGVGTFVLGFSGE